MCVWLINVVSSATQFEPLPEDDVVSAVGQALRDTLGMLNASNTCNMYTHCIGLIQLHTLFTTCTVIACVLSGSARSPSTSAAASRGEQCVRQDSLPRRPGSLPTLRH